MFSRGEIGGLPQLSEGHLPLQELRQGLQLLFQPGEALEARVRRRAQVPLPSLPLQDQAQVQLEHSPERQAHEAPERVVRGAQREQAVLVHGQWELIQLVAPRAIHLDVRVGRERGNVPAATFEHVHRQGSSFLPRLERNSVTSIAALKKIHMCDTRVTLRSTYQHIYFYNNRLEISSLCRKVQ